MQPLETDDQHALYTRAALEELLCWGHSENETLTILNAALRFHATPEARLHTWRELASLHRDLESIEFGGDTGFDDLGDGQYVTLDRETALERAEAALEEALDRAAGTTHTPHRKAA